jgi:aspartyl-tRNA(Asn)/glutamyl-tRNA(Gln) amidotransferase subunit B
MNFLVGKVMQKTKGRADAREAREKLIAKLSE